MKGVRFVAKAREEFLAEVAYYNENEPGLGERFAKAVEEACARTLVFPQAGSLAASNLRRVLTAGFPFSVVYRAEKDGILVFAVAHHKRKPGYWKSRMRR